MASIVMDNLCGWCGKARWQFKCSMCDPRKEKQLCSSCSTLWHSRGAAGCHQLTSSYGETRSYRAWGSLSSSVEAEGKDAAPNAVQGPPATGTAEMKPQEEEKVAGSDDNQAEAKKDAAVPAVAKEGDGETESAKEFDFEIVGESVDSGEDAETANVEQSDEAGGTTKVASAVENSVPEHIPAISSRIDTEAGLKKNGPEDANGKENFTEPTSATPTPSPAEATSTSAPAASIAPPVCSTESTAVATSVADGEKTAPTPTQEPAPQSKLVDLDKLLRWFPTNDRVLMEMLAARIESALVIEDALICARIGKCEEESCRSILLHYEHCKREEVCGAARCAELSIVYKHRRVCMKKDTTPTVDGKKFVCPFCIRIRQRRSLGVVAALDHLISDQRRALQNAQSEANRNFCLQSINTWTQRKQLLRAETDRLNQLASESSVPIFNFPRYQWHFSDAVLIKREPAAIEVSGCTTNGSSAATSAASDANNVLMAAAHEDEEKQDDYVDTLESGDGIPGNANFNADFINQLLRVKAGTGDGSDVAQREFNGVMELGYAIVDASFCAPSKAQRCLLNCKSILVHLQHHLDIQVCTQPMCTAVEHHFAHLSQCKARDASDSCEYCLRVEERQLIRSVDFMEAEQPEAEAKVQKIINDITASFTNQHPDEREQEVIQLEDELEQAEDNKRELTDKLHTARHNLRKVRKNLEHRGMSTAGSHRLPVHFIKVRRNEDSSSKKRRLLGSFD
ncbi:unnamed protein product [Phytophthora fragariaefolia]|uniref:Unnamed protein product n=1 Tax=Phytophthora fragariaefolia TaxID=1490495 RepID=A0A9W6X1C7_9STRA|nr:unnamed protein product [Phytophthora fragariaefolia]